MSKYTLSFLITFLLSTCYAQNFVGKDAFLYKNAIVKPSETSSEGLKQFMYKNFYLQFDTTSKVLTKNYIGKKKTQYKPFQKGEYPSYSEYTQLVGKEFKVIAVYEEAPKYEFDKGQYYVFELKNDVIGTVYYEYDTRFEGSFELTVVGKLNFPEGYWCNKFTIVKDKFKDKTSYYSPEESGFTFIKIIENGITDYYVSVELGSSTLNINGVGLHLLFEDGTKISKAGDVDVKVGDSGRYIYSAFIKLVDQDLEILRAKKITDIRLHIFDEEIQEGSAIKIIEYVKCLIR